MSTGQAQKTAKVECKAQASKRFGFRDSGNGTSSNSEKLHPALPCPDLVRCSSTKPTWPRIGHAQNVHICKSALMATKYPAADHIGGSVRVLCQGMELICRGAAEI